MSARISAMGLPANRSCTWAVVENVRVFTPLDDSFARILATLGG